MEHIRREDGDYQGDTEVDARLVGEGQKLRRRFIDRLEHRAEPVDGHHKGDECYEQEGDDQNELDSVREDGGANAAVGRVPDGEEAHNQRGEQQRNIGKQVKCFGDAGQFRRQEHEHVEDDYAKREHVHSGPVPVPDELGQRVSLGHHSSHLGADPDKGEERGGLADPISYNGGDSRPRAGLGRGEQDPRASNGRNERSGRQGASGAVASDEVVLDSSASAAGVHDSGDDENGGGDEGDGYGESSVEHRFILHQVG